MTKRLAFVRRLLYVRIACCSAGTSMTAYFSFSYRLILMRLSRIAEMGYTAFQSAM